MPLHITAVPLELLISAELCKLFINIMKIPDAVFVGLQHSTHILDSHFCIVVLTLNIFWTRKVASVAKL